VRSPAFEWCWTFRLKPPAWPTLLRLHHTSCAEAQRLHHALARSLAYTGLNTPWVGSSSPTGCRSRSCFDPVWRYSESIGKNGLRRSQCALLLPSVDFMFGAGALGVWCGHGPWPGGQSFDEQECVRSVATYTVHSRRGHTDSGYSVTNHNRPVEIVILDTSAKHAQAQAPERAKLILGCPGLEALGTRREGTEPALWSWLGVTPLGDAGKRSPLFEKG